MSEEVSQFDDPDEMREKFKAVFLTKTRDEWTEAFDGLDACFSPVLDPQEAPLHPHNVHNKTFLKNAEGRYEPAPAPKLSRTPAIDHVRPVPNVGQHTSEVLREVGFSESEISKFLSMGVVEESVESKL